MYICMYACINMHDVHPCMKCCRCHSHLCKSVHVARLMHDFDNLSTYADTHNMLDKVIQEYKQDDVLRHTYVSMTSLLTLTLSFFNQPKKQLTRTPVSYSLDIQINLP
jgi:hypothetical protein